MNNQIKLKIILSIVIIFVILSCNNNSNPSPNDPSTKIEISLNDLKNNYFIIQKNTGKYMQGHYFNGDKLILEGRDYKRIVTPILENINTSNGTATILVDSDGNGELVFKYLLKKDGTGKITLTNTTYSDVNTIITSTNMYTINDISGFTFNGAYFENDKDFNAGFEFYNNKIKYIGPNIETQVYETLWEKTYYNLPNYVGFKTNDNTVFGMIFKKSDGKIGCIIDKDGEKYESTRS